MKFLPHLFENNRRWASAQRAHDPLFFDRLCEIQAPEYLWIGCSDSRVPANEIVALAPGELFVHRNVANLVRLDDHNCMAVVQYAVDVLKVKHVIVTGHYGCGGVRAALDGEPTGFVKSWIEPLIHLRNEYDDELSALPTPDERWARLCELNVLAQVEELSRYNALAQEHEVFLHGWIYDLHDGLLRDLGFSLRLGA